MILKLVWLVWAWSPVVQNWQLPSQPVVVAPANTWIYRSNTGDYPQPHVWHYPGHGPKLQNNVLDVRTIVPPVRVTTIKPE